MPKGVENWKRRRERRVLWTHFVLALGVGLLCFAIGYLVGLEGVARIQIEKVPILGLAIEGILSLLKDSHLKVIVLSLIGGGLFFIFGPKKFAQRIHDRYFGLFNTALLDPVRKPGNMCGDPAVPPLDWIEPPMGSRRWQAWRLLLALTRTKTTGDGLTWLPFAAKSDIPNPFLWTIVVGPSGSGKTRMTQEFARKMARRDRLGDGKDQAWRGRWYRFRAWVRRVVWPVRWKPDDPWDAGIVKESSPGAGWKDWRPARPTILLLEDPMPHACEHWVEKLSDYAENWYYPVRLVVACQAFPSELHVQASNAKDGSIVWRWEKGKVQNVIGHPILLGHRTRFGESEVRQAISSRARQDKRPQGNPHLMELYKVENLEAFLKMTVGNPLLVELGLWALGEGKSLRVMTSETLLKDWAERVVQNWEHVGITGNGEQNLALAAAALVGPLAQRKPIEYRLRSTQLDDGVLRRAFPSLENFSFTKYLPSVQPEQVADAVVKRLVNPRDHADDDNRDYDMRAREVSEAGLLANPDGWIRAVGRLGGVNTPLGRVMKENPVEFVGKDSSTLASVAGAYLIMGLHGLLPPLDCANIINGLVKKVHYKKRPQLWGRLWQSLMSLEARDDDLRRASAMQAAAGQEAVADLAPSDFVHGRPLLLLGLLVWSRAEEFDDNENMNTAIARLTWLARASRSRAYLGESDEKERTFVTDVFSPLFKAISDRLDTDPEAAQTAIHAIDRLTIDHSLFPLSIFRAWLPEKILDLKEASPGLRVLALSCLALSQTDIEDCRKTVDKIEKIAEQPEFAQDREMQLDRVRAWYILATKHAVTPNADKSSQSAVDHIDTITGSPTFSGDREMQILRAHALIEQTYTYANLSNITLCRNAVERIKAIVGQPKFSNDIEMLNSLTQSSANLTLLYTNLADPEACASALEQVEEIAGRPEFVSDYRMQNSLSLALLNLASAYSRRGNSTDIEHCHEASERAEMIVCRPEYSNDSMMQIMLARVLSTLTHFYSEHDNFELCVSVVKRVKEIAGRPEFANDRQVQGDLTRAIANISSIHAKRLDLLACLSAVEQVEEIAGRPEFANDYAMQNGRAVACCFLSLAYAQKGEVAACRKVVAHVEAIAGSPVFANDPRMQSVLTDLRNGLQAISGGMVARGQGFQSPHETIYLL